METPNVAINTDNYIIRNTDYKYHNELLKETNNIYDALSLYRNKYLLGKTLPVNYIKRIDEAIVLLARFCDLENTILNNVKVDIITEYQAGMYNQPLLSDPLRFRF